MKVSPELVQEITDKKIQYCQAVDKQRWDLIDQIATTDFHFKLVEDRKVGDFGGVRASWTSRAEWVAHFSAVFKGNQSHHLIGPGMLEQTGPDEIKAIFPAQYNFADKDNGTKMRITGGVYYEDIWRRGEDGWRLAGSTVDQVYVNVDR